MTTFGESLYGGVITCRKIIAQEADLPSSGGGGTGGTIEISGINLDNKWSISLDNDSNFYLTNDLVNVVGLSGDAHTGKITLFDFKLDDVEDVDTSIKENGSMMYYNSTLQKYEFTDKVRYLVNSLDISSIPIVTVSGDLRIFGDTSANIFLGGDARTTPTLNGGSIGIGYKACDLNNKSYNVAIGCQAGEIEQGKDFLYFTGEAIAIGKFAGQSNQEPHTIAIGSSAGNSNQKIGAISIGYLAGATDQSGDSISIGNQAGKINQFQKAIAIGTLAGLGNQGFGAIGIGESCGYSFQGLKSVAIGSGAGSIRQNEKAIAIGNLCAYTDQSVNSIAIGNEAARTTQNIECIAIGSFAGNLQQGQGIASFIGESVAVGKQAGQQNQHAYAIAIGSSAGGSNQQNSALAIGYQAGATDQSSNSVAIGTYAGSANQKGDAISIGTQAGNSNQGINSIAIGSSSALVTQGNNSVAIGSFSGANTQGNDAVSIGHLSGRASLGSSSIAIGHRASDNGGSFSSTVVLNGTGSDLNPAQANSTYIKPIRSLTQAQTLHYDDGTGEITRTPNVSLTQGDNITITGTYPAFTIAGQAGGGSSAGVYANSTITQPNLVSGVLPLTAWVSQVSSGITSGATSLFTTLFAGWYQLSFSLDQRATGAANNFRFSYIYVLRNGIVIHEIVDNDPMSELEDARTKGGGFLVQMAVGDIITFDTNVNSGKYSVTGAASFVKVDTAAPAAPPISSIAVFGGLNIGQAIYVSTPVNLTFTTQVATGVTATTSGFTCIIAGWYNVDYVMRLTTAGTAATSFIGSDLKLFVNSTMQVTTSIQDTGSPYESAAFHSGGCLVQLIAGDTISFTCETAQVTTSAYSLNGRVSITKVDTTAPAPSINSKVFMRMNTFLQTGTGAEQTITNWTPIISEPANLYQGSTNIFSPPRNGHYSINFQTSIKSTTNNSVNALIKLYQTDVFGTLQLVSHSQEQEANDIAIGQTKYRFLNINIILYLVPTDSLYISTTADGAYELPASPYTNLSIHNVD